MMRVAFLNENTLGHGSYLPVFARALARRPGLGIEPELLNVTPLPPSLARRADFSVRGLRKWGLDFHNARWRLTASRHARSLLDELRGRQQVDAVVVNTQSVGLALADCDLPLFVCLDATFAELGRSPWFAPNRPSRWLLPFTAGSLHKREQALFRAARRLLPWSAAARDSLLNEYQIPPARISLLPPSIELPPPRERTANPRPQILFVGGDFRRKGGPLLLDCFRRHFAARCELHLVTQSDVRVEPGVFVHRGLTAHSAAWRERWEQADVFVFPSTLETFGIVLLEAHAFGVPVVSSPAGAAREILLDGQAGWLLPEPTEAALAGAIREVLADPVAARRRVATGRQLVETRFHLPVNTAQLAAWLRQIT